ncbi:hypothetical protein Goarm_014361, partial [Gossypium armourianum]|nr:hypothetical protein [Gossypium armourianum]
MVLASILPIITVSAAYLDYLNADPTSLLVRRLALPLLYFCLLYFLLSVQYVGGNGDRISFEHSRLQLHQEVLPMQKQGLNHHTIFRCQGILVVAGQLPRMGRACYR